MDKILLALITLLSLSGAGLFLQDKTSLLNQPPNIRNEYIQWKSKFNQNFNGVDDSYRFTVFQENYRFIQEHNAKNDGLTLGLNQFAALTNEEYKQRVSTKIEKSNIDLQESTLLETSQEEDSIDSINWDQKGAVTQPYNQGQCGSCWAFSTIQALEGLRQIKTGVLEKLSAQQVASCVPAPYAYGCNGGNPASGFWYTSQNGITTEDQYPYVQTKNTNTAPCRYKKSWSVFKNGGFQTVKPNNPQQMQAALVRQPLSISVDASSRYFQFYLQGILNSAKQCGDQLDHAILLIGFNKQDPKNPYWTVKNSWGNEWGEGGYARIAIQDGNGVCGINMDVSYPTIQKQ